MFEIIVQAWMDARRTPGYDTSPLAFGQWSQKLPQAYMGHDNYIFKPFHFFDNCVHHARKVVPDTLAYNRFIFYVGIIEFETLSQSPISTGNVQRENWISNILEIGHMNFDR